MSGIIGKKLGMTQIVTDEGVLVPVTAVEAGPCFVTGIRNSDKDGYDAVQLAFGQTRKKRLNKPLLGHLSKASAPPLCRLAEFRGDVAEDTKIGDQVSVEVFEKGQKVKVTGRSKGKGFQGTVKRHRFSRGPVSHGSHNVRAPGSIGASATPSRVFKGIRMPGQMGDRRVTQRGIEIVEVIEEKNVVLLKGALPGAKGGIVEIRSDES